MAKRILCLVVLTIVCFFSNSIALVFDASTTLEYDDGGIDKGCSPWSTEVGSEIAVRFTPSSYPVKLEQVSFFVGGGGKPTTPFEVRVYDDGNGDFPGERLDSNGVTAAAVSGNEWVTIDMSSLNVSISEGDFFVSMRWLTAPGEDGQNAQFLGHDTTPPIDERTVVKWGGSGEWRYRSDSSGCYADAMIRAVIGDSNHLTRVKGIPVANISVDGNLSDWAGLSPIYVDAEGDNKSGHSGCDLRHIYVATNTAKDRLYFAFEMTELPNKEKAVGGQGTMVQYCISFDDFDIGSYASGYYDWQIGVDSENNYWVWDLREEKTYSNEENITWWGKADNTITECRQNEIVEFSIGRSIPYLPGSFSIRFYMVLRDGQNTNPDSMNRDVILTFDPSAFSDTIKSLSNHNELLTWMNENISYGWPGDLMPDPMAYWIYKSPDEVFFSKTGECASQSAFEAYILKQKGYASQLLWLGRTNYSDHAVCYWPDGNGYHYLEHAFYGHEGVYGPFASIEAIGADIYTKLYQHDGLQDSYTLYDMREAAYGSDWAEFNQMLIPLSTCLMVGQDLSIFVDCAKYDGNEYSFMLSYYRHPDDLSGFYWKLDTSTLASGAARDCIPIGADLSMPMECVSYNETQYAFTLKLYPNPYDPSGLYWVMDKSTLTVK